MGESVTYAQLVQYVGLVPNGDLTNLATNAHYTEGEIAAYKSAIPAGSSFENVETYVANEPAATLTEYTVTSDANATGLSLTGVTVSISGNGSGNWTVLVNVGDTIAAESVTQTLPEGTEATSEISISAGTAYDNSAAIAVYQSNASFITGQTWDAEAIYQLVPAIAARHEEFGGSETNETIVPYLSALPGAIITYTGDFAALGDYLSATPDIVDADQLLDRANGVIDAVISNVEASDDATVDIGERLASYSTPVVFDIADDISNVIASVLQTTNNFADVRDIVINDIANISEAIQLVEASNSGGIDVSVEDTTSAILSELSMESGGTNLDELSSLTVTSGIVDVSQAADLQSVTAYDSGASSYTISDSASAILGDTATVIDDGVSTINVDGPVGAGVGVQLGELEDASFETGFSADVNFNIVDDANDITAALSGDTTGAMDNAASLIASGGTATVAEASEIQGVAGYDSGASSYTITDSADVVLAAENESTVLNDGVSGVVVTDATGAGYVSASDGAALTDLEGDLQTVTGDATADINFRVEDSASAIASELAEIEVP